MSSNHQIPFQFRGVHAYNNFVMHLTRIKISCLNLIIGILIVCMSSNWINAAADSQAFLKALQNEDFDAINRMIGQVNNVDTPLDDGRTALMLASKYGLNDVTRNLLQAGADVNARNNNGGTALMYSAIRADLPTVKLLLESGAEVNITAKFDWTALMVAAAKGHAEVVKQLLERDADVNCRDIYQWTPLMRASFAGYTDAVKELLEHPDTHINAQDENGATALHHAATKGHYDTVELLLKNGASLEISDTFGYTAFDRAKAGQHDAILDLLNGRSWELIAHEAIQP